MYNYLFEKVSDLESTSIRTMCFIISMKNTTTSYQVVLKYLYIKKDSIEIYFPSLFFSD
jgi:hypothetical protein